MKLKRFTAPTMAKAINMIKNDLGRDAVILSTRKIKQQNGETGLEITAAVDPQTPPTPQKQPVDLTTPSLPQVNTQAHTPLFSQLTLHGVIPAYAGRIAKAVAALGETGFSIEDGLEMVLSKMLNFTTPQTLLNTAKPLILVGPTGAGKTTTLAKIAVNERAHRANIHLLSFDTYKVGGAEQLGLYADALDVPLTILDAKTPLRTALKTQKNTDLILIDSAGTNPYEPARLQKLADQLEGIPKTVALVLPCNMHATEMYTLPEAFKQLQPEHLIFTKIDESSFMGGLINTGIHSKLPLCFIADGQRVPQDLIQIDPKSLSRKLLTKPTIPWHVGGDLNELTA